MIKEKVIVLSVLLSFALLVRYIVKSERNISALREENETLKVSISASEFETRKAQKIINKIYSTNEERNRQIELNEANNRIREKKSYTVEQIADGINNEFSEFSKYNNV